MPRARISRLTLTGDLPASKRARVSRLALDGTAAAGTTKRARISRLTMDGTRSNRRARISELRLTGSVSQAMVPTLDVTPPGPAEPGTVVALSAAGTTGNTVSTTWSITAGGAGVSLTGSGLTRTLLTPRDYQGRSITVQVSYLDGFGVTDTRSVVITVRPHQMWFCRPDGVLIPITHPFLRI